MEANEINILTAPQLITAAWWAALDRAQRGLLLSFVLLYVVGSVLVSVAVIIDDIYSIHLDLLSFMKGDSKVQVLYNLSVIINRGFWRTVKVSKFSDQTHRLSANELKNHIDIAISLWDTCQVMSYRGSPCEAAGVFCTLFGIALFLYHCTTFILFRVLTILNLSLGAFMIMIGFGLMYSSAQEYLHCLTVLNSENYGRSGYFKGRKFSSNLNMYSWNFSLMLITEFSVLLPMILIGLYLLIMKRANL